MSDLNTRKEKRTPVTLKIKFKSATLDQFIERYSVDVSHGGIFIRTKDPLAVGTTLRFEFQLQDASPLISGEGTVVWTREFDPSRVGVAPGMGVRFDRLATQSQAVLEKILAQKGKDGVEPKFDVPTVSEKTKIAPAPLVSGLQAKSAETSGKPVVASGSGPVATQAAPAPDPLKKGLGLAPKPGGFHDEPSRDATPIPKPMPFTAAQADDDFADDVFDQPTRVASLDSLLKQAGQEAPEDDALNFDRQPTVAANGKTLPAAPAAAKAPPAPPKAPPAPPPKAEVKAEAKPEVPAAAPPAEAARPKLELVTAKPEPEAEAAKFEAAADEEPETAPLPVLREAKPTPVEPRVEQTARVTPPSMDKVAEAKADAKPEAKAEPKVAVAAEPARRPAKKSPVGMIAALLVLALVAGGAVWWVKFRKPADAEQPATTANVAPAPAPVAPPVEVKPAEPTPPPEAPKEAAVTPPAAPEGPKVTVESDPPGATVEVDGVAVGTTPVDVPVAADKPVKAVVKQACFKDETVTLDAKAGKVAVPMKPLDRVANVVTEPTGANVFVDGKPAGRGPIDVKLGKDARDHKITVKKTGYLDGEATIAAAAACATDGKVGRLEAVSVALALKPAPVKPVAVREPKPRVVKPDTQEKPEETQPDVTKPEDTKPVEVKPIEVKATDTKPVETKPVETKPVETKPADKPKPVDPPKTDCDPSPDAPDWARCK